jgi:hypothetical protein
METTTQTITREDWQSVLEGLGQRHRGWAATIEIIGLDVGDQFAADGLPFQGISYETRGSAAGSILVEVGDEPDDYMVHRVASPRAVRIAFSRPGSQADIQLESDDGTMTLVTLCPRRELPEGRTTTSSPRRRSQRHQATWQTPGAAVGAVLGAFVLGLLLGSRCPR